MKEGKEYIPEVAGTKTFHGRSKEEGGEVVRGERGRSEAQPELTRA